MRKGGFISKKGKKKPETFGTTCLPCALLGFLAFLTERALPAPTCCYSPAGEYGK